MCSSDLQARKPALIDALLICSCHRGEAKRLTVDTSNPMVFQSCGEDGKVLLFDLREPHICRRNGPTLANVSSCMSMDSHPLQPNSFIVSGESSLVYSFDRRVPNQCQGVYSALSRESSSSHITGVAYNHNGTQLVASYSRGNPIFCFSTADDSFATEDEVRNTRNANKFQQQYEGHTNIRTVKSVNFFGAHSEYVVSGSDCGNIFLWNTFSGAIVNVFQGDRDIVNCIVVCISSISALTSIHKVLRDILMILPYWPPRVLKMMCTCGVPVGTLRRHQKTLRTP